MKYKMLVLDIDGTLLNSKKEITPATQEALIKLQERGVRLVLASGRPTPGLQKCAAALRLSHFGSFTLSYNGARIINCATNEIIYEKTLSKDIIPLLYQESVNNNVSIISYENDCVITANDIDKYMELEARINGIPIKKVDNFETYINFNVCKCLMTGEPEHLASVEKYMLNKYGSMLSICRSEPFFLEIMSQNIDKAYSLGQLLQYLKLLPSETICCGDGFNDISMIKFAGLGVAMDNAQEVVKKAADYITASNDNDGIVEVIDKFFV